MILGLAVLTWLVGHTHTVQPVLPPEKVPGIYQCLS